MRPWLCFNKCRTNPNTITAALNHLNIQVEGLHRVKKGDHLTLIKFKTNNDENAKLIPTKKLINRRSCKEVDVWKGLYIIFSVSLFLFSASRFFNETQKIG